MCGMYVHGFYWQDKDEHLVILDLKNNSHYKIKANSAIPNNAIRIGINPVDGIAASNDPSLLPAEVTEKAEKLFCEICPDIPSITRWIKDNYGKEGDRAEWDSHLLQMLGDGGIGLFAVEYYKQQIEYYQEQIEYYQEQIEYCQKQIEYGQEQIEYYKQQNEYYKQQIEYCQKQSEYCQKQSETCTGTLTSMDIDAYIPYFMKHPNNYWKERN